MSFINKIGSALGKLLIVACLAAAFFIGMVYVVYRSLQGNEIIVPEIVGKNAAESEKELEALGLKIKKRAERYSEEPPNTVLEQLPKAGDTVKTGQLILIVTSVPNPEGDEKPTTIKKGNTTTDQDDSEKIEELISDKPKKKTNSNTNTNKKKAPTSRDTIKDNSNSDSNSTDNTKNSTDTNGSTKDNKDNKNGSTNPVKQPTPAASPKATPKPSPNKTPATSGDVRPRRNR